jgi:hypothetical protein
MRHLDSDRLLVAELCTEFHPRWREWVGVARDLLTARATEPPDGWPWTFEVWDGDGVDSQDMLEFLADALEGLGS